MLRRRLAAVLVACATLAPAAALAAPASAATWKFETLDGNSTVGGRLNANVGYDNAAVVWNNQPHVFYRDETNLDLRHAWWTGTTWNFETLDGDSTTGGRVDGEVGGFVTVVVWANQPHAFYYDRTRGDMRHAWWTGSAWNYETLDGNATTGGRVDRQVGSYNFATVWSNQPHVFYRDVTNGDLRHAWWNGAAWFFETLDGAGGADGRIDRDLGAFGSVVVYRNQPHVYYRNVTDADLRHAWWTGTRWRFETLDGDSVFLGRTTGDVGSHTAAIVWNTTMHVFHYDATNDELRQTWWNGRTWNYANLDGTCGAAVCVDGRIGSMVGSHIAATVWNGTPHVWYRDLSANDLRYAYWTGSAWRFSTLDGNSTVGGRVDGIVGDTNAVVVWNNQPHVFTRDGTGFDLRHAWYG